MDEFYKYYYKRSKTPMVWFISFLLVAYTILRFRYTPIWSIVSGLAGSGLLISRDGIELDFQNRKYRTITSFGPQDFGTWKDLKDIKYVSVFKATLVSEVESFSARMIRSEEKVIQVNLIVGKNQRIRLLETKDPDGVFGFAKDIAAKLNLRIWDATERKGKWYEEEASSLVSDSNIPTPA